MMKLTPLFALLASVMVMPSVSALGINCRGGGGAYGCKGSDKSIDRLEEVMRRALDAGVNTWYGPGKHIACHTTDHGHKCAFFQNNGAGGNLQAAWESILHLIEHGCETCGSVPLDLEANDVKHGELTVNYIAVERKTCAVECDSVNVRYPMYFVCQDPYVNEAWPAGADGQCLAYSKAEKKFQEEVEQEKHDLAVWECEHEQHCEKAVAVGSPSNNLASAVRSSPNMFNFTA